MHNDIWEIEKLSKKDIWQYAKGKRLIVYLFLEWKTWIDCKRKLKKNNNKKMKIETIIYSKIFKVNKNLCEKNYN